VIPVVFYKCLRRFCLSEFVENTIAGLPEKMQDQMGEA